MIKAPRKRIDHQAAVLKYARHELVLSFYHLDDKVYSGCVQPMEASRLPRFTFEYTRQTGCCATNSSADQPDTISLHSSPPAVLPVDVRTKSNHIIFGLTRGSLCDVHERNGQPFTVRTWECVKFKCSEHPGTATYILETSVLRP
jgi:hypothetical protein